MDLASSGSEEIGDRLGQGRCNRIHIHGWIRAHTRHFDSTAQVEHCDRWELADELETQGNDPQPDLRVRAGANVRVDAPDGEAVFGNELPYEWHTLVPDAETGRHAAGVGAIVCTGALQACQATDGH
jgi:hypothetical protein